LLKEKGIPSHYIDTIEENEMIVEPAIPLGMPAEAPGFSGSAPLSNLEFTWRNSATGSFWRRHPFVRPCKNLHERGFHPYKNQALWRLNYEAEG